MIQLTESLIAVEVPNVATEILLIRGNTSLVYFQPNYVRIDSSGMTGIIGVTPLSNEQRRDVANLQPNYVIVDLSCKAEYLVGVTPLSEEQWKEVVGSHTSSEKMYCDRTPYIIPVSPKDRWNDLQRHKGLDINNRYAIIKIEK